MQWTASALAPGVHLRLVACKGGQLSTNRMTRAAKGAHAHPLQSISWMRSPDGKRIKKPLA